MTEMITIIAVGVGLAGLILNGQKNIREQIDQRLDLIGQRLDLMDGRLGQMDVRFDQVDARFEKLDVRFDQVDGCTIGRVIKWMPLNRRGVLMKLISSNALAAMGTIERLGFESWKGFAWSADWARWSDI